ncbi:MAG TPA: delta-60 repeat domain-containing protein, partial [Planctomycetaceae bacterium]
MPVRARLGLIAALAISAAFSPAPTASAAPGDLDPTFGEGGVVQILSSNEESNAKSVAVQPDDKILVAGHELGDLAVIRLLENGQPDPTFSGDGKAVIELPSGFSEARAVTVQPDGKIVVAGGGQGATKGDFLVARFNADGKPDPGFGGGDGVVTLPVGDDDDEAFGVDVGADGRIAATGKAEAGGAEVAGVVVLLANGTPDDSFALDGDITVKTPPGHDTGEEVALLGDGRVLIADSSGAGGGDGFSLVQLLSSGLPDPEFGGGDGLVLTPIPAEGLAEGNGRITDFAVLGDGRIVASGYGDDFVGTPPDFDGKVAAVRYLPDGEIDVGFADSGFFTQQLPGSDAAEAVEPAEGGRLLLAGGYDEPTSGGRAPAALRLTADGDLDPVFGVGGVVLR